MSRPLSGDLLTAISRVELKNTLSGNFQKSEINTCTWNFGMYDIPLERKELIITVVFVRLHEMAPVYGRLNKAMLSQHRC